MQVGCTRFKFFFLLLSFIHFFLLQYFLLPIFLSPSTWYSTRLLKCVWCCRLVYCAHIVKKEWGWVWLNLFWGYNFFVHMKENSKDDFQSLQDCLQRYIFDSERLKYPSLKYQSSPKKDSIPHIYFRSLLNLVIN